MNKAYITDNLIWFVRRSNLDPRRDSLPATTSISLTQSILFNCDCGYGIINNIYVLAKTRMASYRL